MKANRHSRSIADLAKYLLGDKMKSKLPRRIFITGTDTGVGKTELTCLLLKEFRSIGIFAAGFKPICCGDRADARKFWNLADRKIPLDTMNPIHLPQPLAPSVQKCPPWNILCKKINRSFKDYYALGVQMILIEGAGGLLCPITSKYTMRELAESLGSDILIVTPNRLGALNQTLLVLEAVSHKKLACKAVVLNSLTKKPDRSVASNLIFLRQMVKVPIFQVTSVV